jgi:hypothetical protein
VFCRRREFLGVVRPIFCSSNFFVILSHFVKPQSERVKEKIQLGRIISEGDKLFKIRDEELKFEFFP